ncbi:MAG: retropepsin-like aspartic protease [Blastocatellia bacterium]
MSQYQLSFSHLISYFGEPEIIVPIILSSSTSIAVPVDAKFDPGSTFCVFERVYADMLGIEIEHGDFTRIRTATGSFSAYGHELNISVKGIEWSAVVYFAEDEHFPVSVVGRIGFLDRFRIGLIDYDQELYLSQYEGN